MKYEIDGVILAIGAIETVGKSGFKKRVIVIDDNPEGEHHNEIPFEATGDAMTLPDRFKVGDAVRVGFYVNGRGWDSPKDNKRHYFPSLRLAGLGAVPKDGEQPEPADDEDIPF